MILYNVTIKVEQDSADEWAAWMAEEHMPDLLKTGLFTNYRLSRLLEQDETDGITFSAQYACRNIQQYNDYISHYAESMREKVMKKFAGKFVAFRSVMEVVSES